MDAFHYIDLRRLQAAGLLQLCTDTITAISNVVTAPADLLQLKPETDGVATARAPMDARYLTPKSSLNTPVVQALDLRRDNAASLIGFVVRGQCLSSNPARKAAAQRILHFVEPYGIIPDKAYQDETTVIASLVSDLTGMLAADINTLGLTADVVELKIANNDFSTAYGARNAENPDAGDDPNLGELRPAVEAALKKLLDRIEDILGFTRRAAPWPVLVGIINNIIDRYNVLLDRRGGGNGGTPPPTP